MSQTVPEEAVAPLASQMAAEPVGAVSIRRFVEAFELDSDAYLDDAAARSAGHDRRIAPWSMAMVAAMPAYWSPGDPPLAEGFVPPFAWDCVDLPGTEMMSTRVGLFFERPLRAGDLLRSDYRVTKVVPKRTSVGEGNFVDFEVRLADRSGDTVATERSTVFRYTPATTRAVAKPRKARDPLRAQWDREAGAPIGQHTFGLSLQRLIMCSAACRDFAASHLIDRAAQAGGAPRAYADMNFALAMVEKLLLRWAGPSLRVHALGPLDIGDFVLAGMDVTTSGSILAQSPCRDAGRCDVTVSVALSQPDGRTPITGRASACVPEGSLASTTGTTEADS
ncbi:MAG: FAS1-like dehydratase domain-containing protein [Streptosporangiaceae bacterium]